MYAGGGGTSEGAEMAGVKIVWASNHKQVAVDYHKLNHPNALHVCQDLQLADWSLVPDHDILYSSPCCQGHSFAAGVQSQTVKADKSRATAWAIIDCLGVTSSEIGIIENTAGFIKWNLYEVWLQALETLGYSVSINMVNAADLGIPQSRERIFFVITKSKHPIKLKLPKREHVGASSFLDLEFEGHEWDLVSNKCPKTQQRIHNGRKQYGDLFLDASYGTSVSGKSIHKPIGTITCVNHHYVVNGEFIRPITLQEAATAQTFRSDYIWPKGRTITKEMIGNAVPPKMAMEVTNAVRIAA